MSLTVANATIFFSIAGLFPAPVQINGFAADDVFSTEAQELTETSQGVDGKLSGGFVFVPVKQSITLQADSNANAIFDAWIAAQKALRDTYTASAVFNLKGLGTSFAFTTGYLTSYPPMPDGGKILKPRKFGITWQNSSPAPL